MSNKITAQDLLSFTFYGGLKCKKDTVIFVQASMDEKEDAYHFDLMRYKDGACTPLTNRHTVSSFIYEDKNTIWFAQSKDDDTALMQLKLDGGEAQQKGLIAKKNVSLIGFLNTDTLVVSCEEIINEKEQPVHPDYEVLDETPFYFNGQGFVNKKRSQLYLYSVKEGTLGEKISGDNQVSNVCLHDGKVYFTGEAINRIRKEEDGLMVYDPAASTLQTLIEPHVFKGIYTLDAIKDKLLFFATDGNPIGLNSNPCLYEYNLGGQSWKKAMEWGEALGNSVGTDCAAVGGNAVVKYKGKLYFTSTIVSHNNLFCYDENGIHQILEWPGTIHSFGFSKGRLFFIGAKPNELQQLYMMENDIVSQLSDFNPVLKDRFVSEAKPVFYKGYDGREQMGWVLYPKDFESGKTYPAILDIHGGPKTVYGTVFYHEMQMWASKGYFVFFCNPFGSDGQGNEYANMNNRYGTWDYQDLMTFTDTVLAQIPEIDPKRVGVTGGSYGGFMTNWIIGHTDRFAAAASQRSISNWLSFYGTSDIGPEFTKDQQGCGLENIDQLWEHSPLKYAGNVTTPALFIHSDEDYRCPLEQGLQMYNGIISQDKPARLVMFRKENHELSRSGKPSHRLRRLNEITDWMDKWTNETDKQA